MAHQKPLCWCTKGVNSKFIPKMPAIRFSGRNTAVSAVSVRMMSLVRLLCTLKCICTTVSVLCSRRRTWCTTRSMCSSRSRLRTLSRSSSRGPCVPSGALQVSSASIQSCTAWRWSSHTSSSSCSDRRASSSAPQLVKRVRGRSSSVCQWSSWRESSRRRSRNPSTIRLARRSIRSAGLAGVRAPGVALARPSRGSVGWAASSRAA